MTAWRDLTDQTKNLLEMVENPWTGRPGVVVLDRASPLFAEAYGYVKGEEGALHIRIVEEGVEAVRVTVREEVTPRQGAPRGRAERP